VLVREDIYEDRRGSPVDFTRTVWPGDTTRLVIAADLKPPGGYATMITSTARTEHLVRRAVDKPAFPESSSAGAISRASVCVRAAILS
jgi:hypothetical protein